MSDHKNEADNQFSTILPEDIVALVSGWKESINTISDAYQAPSAGTPKDVVLQSNKMTLYHFKHTGKARKKSATPVLIVYALVNRFYMTDLKENRSMIKGLLEAGQDVYLIDWGYPDRSDRFLTLDDYINGYIDQCVDAICKQHHLSQINLLGICQGGVLSLGYSALHPEKVKNLITMVTPVDFKTPDNVLSHWVSEVDIDLMVDTLGNIPGDMLSSMFLKMKPHHLLGRKYLEMFENSSDTNQLNDFMLMEQWIFDTPDQVGETFREFVKGCYQENTLMHNKLRVGDDVVDLNNITMPVLNIYAESDHLVPPAASRALQGCIPSDDYTELSFKGGHIGIFVSSKSQKTIPPAIAEWLDKRS